jgi:hypothetical protein
MIILCDIDGTLAHMNGKRTPFEWDKVHLDDYDPFVGYCLLNHWDAKDKIILVSGRDAVCQPATLQWLTNHGVPYHSLFMRPVQDFRPDTVVKREIWDTKIMPTYGRMFTETEFVKRCIVYDDRDVVVKMWRDMGLKVFQVAPGDFDKPKPIPFSQVKLIWDDPDPVPGTDYTVRSMRWQDYDDHAPILITYGSATEEPMGLSEAEVFPHELMIHHK